jgi:hypothetical protein
MRLALLKVTQNDPLVHFVVEENRAGAVLGRRCLSVTAPSASWLSRQHPQGRRFSMGGCRWKIQVLAPSPRPANSCGRMNSRQVTWTRPTYFRLPSALLLSFCLFFGLPAGGRWTSRPSNASSLLKKQSLPVASLYALQPNPSHSSKRDTKESTNDLLCQYPPKGTDLMQVPDEQLRSHVRHVNHRSRKSPVFRSPFEIFPSKPPGPLLQHTSIAGTLKKP